MERGRNCWAGVWYFLRSCTADLSGLNVFLSAQDMNREVVKTDSATTRIPELDFEIPAFSQKGGRYKVQDIWAVHAWLQSYFFAKTRVPGLVADVWVWPCYHCDLHWFNINRKLR